MLTKEQVEALTSEEKAYKEARARYIAKEMEIALNNIICSRAGRTNIIAKVVINSQDSYANAKNTYMQVGVTLEEVYRCNEDELCYLIFFKGYHEMQHILSTTEDYNKAIEDIMSMWIARAEKLGLRISRQGVNSTSKNLCNSQEDGRIENIMCIENIGLDAPRKWYREYEWLNTSVEENDSELTSVMWTMHSIATRGKHLRNFIERWKGTRAENVVNECIPFITKMVSSVTCKEAMRWVKEIAKKISDIVIEAFDLDNDNNQQNASQMEQMSSQISDSNQLGQADSTNEAKGNGQINNNLNIQSIDLRKQEQNNDDEKQNGSSADSDTDNGSGVGSGNDNDKKDGENKETSASGDANEEAENNSSKAKSSNNDDENDNADKSNNNDMSKDNSSKKSNKQDDSISKSKSDNDFRPEDAIDTLSDDYEKITQEELEERLKAELENIEAFVRNEFGKEVDKVIGNITKSVDEEQIRQDANKIELRSEFGHEHIEVDVAKLTENREIRNPIRLNEIKSEGEILRERVDNIIRNLSDVDKTEVYDGEIDEDGIYKLATGNFDFFRSDGEPLEADMCCYILKDNSGSMSSGDKERVSCETLALLEEIYKDIIPLKLVAFDSSYGTTHYNIKNWEETDKDRNYSWSFYNNYGPRSANDDAYSITVATKDLLKRTEEHKLLIVISDGCPCGKDGPNGVKEAVIKARDNGIMVIGIYISHNTITDSDRAYYENMYSSDSICVPHKEIGNTLVDLMENYIATFL